MCVPKEREREPEKTDTRKSVRFRSPGLRQCDDAFVTDVVAAAQVELAQAVTPRCDRQHACVRDHAHEHSAVVEIREVCGPAVAVAVLRCDVNVL